eukprot:TRINITY_DN12643_c0_g1_i2.p1 TRINITY_DN12643_c0_g1~~TRINITY_DN12643_c0_g1_i2.p1  ORF type:complete len:505 (+),score=65.23 TRINITY_DN12643_c0_g1_i2:68-1516(+)
MPPPTCARRASAACVDQVKANQGADPNWHKAWDNYCSVHGLGVADPARHTDRWIVQACHIIGPPQVAQQFTDVRGMQRTVYVPMQNSIPVAAERETDAGRGPARRNRPRSSRGNGQGNGGWAPAPASAAGPANRRSCPSGKPSAELGSGTREAKPRMRRTKVVMRRTEAQGDSVTTDEPVTGGVRGAVETADIPKTGDAPEIGQGAPTLNTHAATSVPTCCVDLSAGSRAVEGTAEPGPSGADGAEGAPDTAEVDKACVAQHTAGAPDAREVQHALENHATQDTLQDRETAEGSPTSQDAQDAPTVPGAPATAEDTTGALTGDAGSGLRDEDCPHAQQSTHRPEKTVPAEAPGKATGGSWVVCGFVIPIAAAWAVHGSDAPLAFWVTIAALWGLVAGLVLVVHRIATSLCDLLWGPCADRVDDPDRAKHSSAGLQGPRACESDPQQGAPQGSAAPKEHDCKDASAEYREGRSPLTAALPMAP